MKQSKFIILNLKTILNWANKKVNAKCEWARQRKLDNINGIEPCSKNTGEGSDWDGI
jgi:hypothetical protein